MSKNRPAPKTTPQSAAPQKAAETLSPLAALSAAIAAPDAPDWAETPSAPIFRTLFWVGIAILAVAMPVLSFSYGLSGDENVHRLYGEKALDFFKTFGADEEALTWRNLYFYGVSFDLLVALINKTFGIEAVYHTRHFVNALCGVFLFLGVGKLTKELSGWRGAFFSLVFIVLSPAIFGHSMNNLKDLPFAAGYAWTLLYIIRLIKEMPNVTRRTLVLTALAMGLTLSIRVGGLLVFPYLFLFLGVAWLWLPHTRAQVFGAGMWSFASKISLVAIGAYFVGIITWPYALKAPLSNPVKALGEMEKFSTSIRILFEGKLIWSDAVPWYYIPKWFMITSPLFVFVGIILAVIMFVLANKNTYIRLFLSILSFAVLFPVVYAIYKHSPLYDGMRHFLFVYPIIIAIVAYAFDAFLARFAANNMIKWTTATAMVILGFLPLRFMIVNHPYQYLYFNEAFGGVPAAFGNYETDYWMNSIKPMAAWFKTKYKAELESGKPMLIATDCVDQVNYEISRFYPNVKTQYMRYANRSDKAWDYGFFVTRYIDPGFLQNAWYPGGKAIYTATADGTPIGAILERKEGYDLQGFKATEQNNIGLADSLWQQEIRKYPKNEAVRYNLANLYVQTKRFPEAQKQLDALLAVAPNYSNGLTLQGMSYMQQNQIEKAREIFERVINDNNRDIMSAYYLALIYAQKGDMQTAVQYIDSVVAAAPDFKPAAELQQQLYQKIGAKR